MAETQVFPSIIMPNRDFLIGALYGFNVAKKMYGENHPEIMGVGDSEIPKDHFFIGYWLELTCTKCKRLYCYDNPNDVPTKNLVCETSDCGNHIIVYNVGDPKSWRIGSFTFV
jgi:hypothetical protein